MLGTVFLIRNHWALTSASQTAPANTPMATNLREHDVTVLLDFSASFAPYTPSDTHALQRVTNGIEDLVGNRWNTPMANIIWRRIGTSSVSAPPICPIISFVPKLGSSSRDQLKADIVNCMSRVKKQNVQPDGYTDISTAIELSAKSREFTSSDKQIIIFSDFDEDPAPGSKPSPFHLNGETVVMIHRPGTHQTEMVGYLERINQWAARISERGASRVVNIPEFALSASNLAQLLDQSDSQKGTIATLLIDAKDRFDIGTDSDSGDLQYVRSLGDAIVNLADDAWSQPVTINVAIITPNALRMHWMEPIFFERRLAQGRTSDVITDKEKLRIALDESILGLRRYVAKSSTADVAGAIAFSQFGSQTHGQDNFIFVVSDFASKSGDAPVSIPQLPPRSNAVMLYRPATQDSSDPAAFFARVDSWKERFKAAKAQRTCALEMATFSEGSLHMCLAGNGR